VNVKSGSSTQIPPYEINMQTNMSEYGNHLLKLHVPCYTVGSSM